MRTRLIAALLLSGALVLAALKLVDPSSHLGPGFPGEDLPNHLLIVAIILAILGIVLLFAGRLELITKTAEMKR